MATPEKDQKPEDALTSNLHQEYFDDGMVYVKTRGQRADAMARDFGDLREVDQAALSKLNQYQKLIESLARREFFKVEGRKIKETLRQFNMEVDSSGLKKGKEKFVVPDSVAKAYQTLKDLKLDEPDDNKKLFVELIEFVASMRDEVSQNHGGRDQATTQVFFEEFFQQHGTTIFHEDSEVAKEFDEGVANKLGEIAGARLVIKEKNAIQNMYYSTIGTDHGEEFVKFVHNSEIDRDNINRLKAIISNLKEKLDSEGIDKDDKRYASLQFLSITLDRMMFTFNKDHLQEFKQDFLAILKAIDPVSQGQSELNAFCKHRAEVMTSSDDRFKKLFMDAAITALTLAAPLAIGAAVLPLVATTNTAQNFAFGIVKPEVVAGKAVGTGLGLAKKDDLNALYGSDSPIITVRQRDTTASENYLKWTGEKKQQQFALMIASGVAGVIFGPVLGPVIAGIIGVGGSAILYAYQSKDAWDAVREMDKLSKDARKAHEEDFFKICKELGIEIIIDEKRLAKWQHEHQESTSSTGKVMGTLAASSLTQSNAIPVESRPEPAASAIPESSTLESKSKQDNNPSVVFHTTESKSETEEPKTTFRLP